MRARRLVLLLVLAAACRSAPRNPYVRVIHESGRVYYTRTQLALASDAEGFVTFRDLVTKEQVRLPYRSYQAEPCTRNEVKEQQLRYIEDPTWVPRVEIEGKTGVSAPP